MIGPAEHDILIETDIEPGSRVNAQVMDDGVFFGIGIIAQQVLAAQLHKNILIIQFPDTRIEFQEEIRSAIVAEEQAAVAITDKVLIVSELEIEVFPGIEINRGPVIEIIDGGLSEILIISGPGHCLELGDPIHHEPRTSFLVVGQVGGETQFSGDHATEGKPFGIEKDPFFIPRFIGLGLLDGWIDSQEKIFFIHLVKIGLCFIKGIEPGPFADKTVLVAADPFAIVHEQRSKVLPVYL